ncbi:hypothetical protein BDY19DRAFT_1049570 [Irpex rosettiformis]|uniref:Uncharacterized protein n=1 Tax=Irpex rosettiformis TaxID=378272 RepID=A0ACB8TYV0_9APHY|nr:hypothetical protein BDY19DRAFT_1049570 [Irpex rosettiformis]
MDFPDFNEIGLAVESADSILDALYIINPNLLDYGQLLPTPEGLHAWGQGFPNLQYNADNTLANQPAGQEDANEVEGEVEAGVSTETVDHEENVEKTPESEVEKDVVEATPADEDNVQVVEEVAPAEVTAIIPKNNSVTTPKKPASRRKDQNLDCDGAPPPPPPANIKRKRFIGTFANDDTRDVEDASVNEDSAVQLQKRMRYMDVTGSGTNESVNEKERANEEVHEADKDTHVVEGGQDAQEVSENNAAPGDETTKDNATPSDEDVAGEVTTANEPEANTPAASVEDEHPNQEAVTDDAGAVPDAPPANNVSTLLVNGVLHELRHPCPYKGCTYFLDDVLDSMIGKHFVEEHQCCIIHEEHGQCNRRCILPRENGICRQTFIFRSYRLGDHHKSVGKHVLRYHTMHWETKAYECTVEGCKEGFYLNEDRQAHLKIHHHLDKASREAHSNKARAFREALWAHNKANDPTTARA